ncbi:MAG: type II toxin-antitoxin system mRNA interferase toxin, RelE/StbE family [Bacilli bacterium]|nr:type II toxin-antitoxin system mRNA interferase toxin, RelE/StbE family [Bacilli bacterium]
MNNKYFKNYRECYIESDWLLVYKYSYNEVILFLIETRGHSEVLGK